MFVCVRVARGGPISVCLCVGGGGGIIEIIFLFPGDGLMTGRARKWGGGYSGNLTYSLRDCFYMCLYGSPAFKVFITFYLLFGGFLVRRFVIDDLQV